MNFLFRSRFNWFDMVALFISSHLIRSGNEVIGIMFFAISVIISTIGEMYVKREEK